MARTTTSNDVTGWVGWIYFASMLMLVVGGLQVISGFVGLFHKDFYVHTAQGWVLFNNYTTWGWIDIVVGILVISAAMSLLSGRLWARIFSSIIIVFNMLANLAFLPAYPWWSIIGLTLNALVLWAITMHGSELYE